jgi:hypothetical protein
VNTDLDRQIQEALAVDPSPEFQARVRIRLAEEPRRSHVGTGWLLSGVTGIAAVAVLAVLVSSRDDVRPRPADAVAPPAARSAPAVEPAPAAGPAIPAPPSEPIRRVTGRNTIQTVLVPPSEREAFRRFLQAVTENRVTHVVLPDLQEDALNVPDITIDPIVIEPIDAAGE